MKEHDKQLNTCNWGEGGSKAYSLNNADRTPNRTYIKLSISFEKI